MKESIDSINRSGADILFIALGSPKQEQWIGRYLPGLNVKVCQGIGGTLDTIAGTVKRAPLIFQRVGLEWFYRLITEPKRLRRQLMLPVFAFNVVKEKLRSLQS
jgi:N-acetylglucosaminyldiphosphoundecaprenol N-acetyl-beta-D-mannosaminyltransferase